MRIIAFILLFLMNYSIALSDDSTSYSPPGVVQNLDMDRHGTAISNVSTLTVNTTVTAPIYYDSDNTAYYLSPAGNSNVHRLFVDFNGGMPTTDYDTATKKYVDSKLSSYNIYLGPLKQGGSGTISLGVRNFCAINAIRSDSGDDGWCQVYKSGTVWYMTYSQQSYCWCQAICFY